MCTKFHRVHPETARNCTASDLYPSENLKPGEYLAYRCKNGLWDVVTPFFVGSEHLGNIFTGQFFYDDEEVDEEYFLRQAEKYGFEKKEYMEAVRNIPRYSRETIHHLVKFLVKFTSYISKISLMNIRLQEEFKERRLAEEAFGKSEIHLRTLIKTIPDLIWMKDQDGVYLMCNSRFEDFFGAKEKEIIGKTDYDFVEKEQADFFRRHDKVAMDLGRPSRNEEKVTFAVDGHSEILETIKTPMFLGDDQIAGVLGIGRDMTERKLAEKEKIKFEEQYFQAQKMESVGRLAGGIAHDLNNMLSPILGYGEMLQEYFSNNDARREMVDEILNAGFKARDLVKQLLAFSRKQTLAYKHLNLNDAIKGLEKLLRRTIREDIEIKVDLSPDIPVVMADIGQIEQVIMNLAVNSADAMPDGGCFCIETASVYLDECYASSCDGVSPGPYIMIAVSDTGIGMDDNIKDHLFEPFFSTKGDQGTGLGLAMVYGIVKQHGGDICVYSEVGIGTTFKVYLPITDAPDIDEETQEGADIPLKGSETILLVEDSEQVRNLVNKILRRLGYRVIVAENGFEAIKLLEKLDFHVDLLLTDVIMPGLNGRNLYLKVAEKFPDIKVLYMSGYTDNIVNQHGLLDEENGFIQKPFNAIALSLKLRQLISEEEFA